MQEYPYEEFSSKSAVSAAEDIEKSSNSLPKRVLYIFKMYSIQISIIITLISLCSLPCLIIDANASNKTKSEAATQKAPKMLHDTNQTSILGETQTKLSPKKLIAITNTPFNVSTNKPSKVDPSKQRLSANNNSLDNAVKKSKLENKTRDMVSSKNLSMNKTTASKHTLAKQTGGITLLKSSSLLFNRTESNKSLKNRSENSTSLSSAIPFGEQAASSLFSPSFLKGLLSTQKSSNGGREQTGGSNEEEEEEVTQTIVMPISGPQAAMTSNQVETDDHIQVANPSAAYGGRSHQLTMFANNNQQQFMHPYHLQARQNNQNRLALAVKDSQLQPEASLQMSRTEMNQLLNDREAPDFYREREVNGDGVIVGEEQPRLGTAASNMGGVGGYGSGSFPMSGSSFDGGDSFGNNRLLQSPSEDTGFGGSGAGFNHRFGSSGFGNSVDDLGSSIGAHSGKLMQSPAEFNEMGAGVNSFGGHGEARNFGGYGQGDFSNSGMLKAGSSSGEFDGTEMSQGYDSGFDGRGMSMHSGGGYSNSPVLDRHSSELYGLGFNQGHFSSDFGPSHSGRLMGAGSTHPNSFGSSRMPFGSGGGDEYTTRFGAASSMGSNGQGFANSNNMMMRGNSMITNSMQDTSGLGMMREPSSESGISGNGGRGGKLRPLSPIIPVAEEVGSASNYREISSEKGGSRDQFGNPNSYQQRGQSNQPQVHESLEDDPTSPVDTGDDSESSSNQFESTTSGVGQGMNSDGSDGTSTNGNLGDETTTASIHEVQPRTSRASDMGQQGPSLVLNVPPSNIDNEYSQYQSPSNNQNRQQMVEFSRVGSAGYLAPSFRTESSTSAAEITQPSSQQSYGLRQKILKKTSGFMSLDGHDQPQKDSYDPAENPAHAGKYIID